MLLVDTNASIGDCDGEKPGPNSGTDRHGSLRSVSDGVFQEVDKNLLHAKPLCLYLRQLLLSISHQLQSLCGGLAPVDLNYGIDDLGHVYRCDLPGPARMFQLGEKPDVLNQVDQPVGVPEDGCEVPSLLITRILEEGFGIALDGCQGCPEFVGDVGCEVPLDTNQIVHFGYIAECEDGPVSPRNLRMPCGIDLSSTHYPSVGLPALKGTAYELPEVRGGYVLGAALGDQRVTTARHFLEAPV